MAMFDIKNSKKMTLTDCETDSSKLVEADYVGIIEAERCRAGKFEPVVEPVRVGFWKKISLFILEKSAAQLIAKAVLMLVALLLSYFGISKFY